MKYLRYIILSFVLISFVLAGLMIKRFASPKLVQEQTGLVEHIYATWDTMEFDKCVAAWLILRFIDNDAKFIFYPQGTEIKQGILFDVPGADWSRKHLQCTSQCILASMQNSDSAIEEIVSIASKTELNFWQLDRWPQAQKCFYEVKEIMDQNPDPLKCFEKTFLYFDNLYSNLKKDGVTDNGTGVIEQFDQSF